MTDSIEFISGNPRAEALCLSDNPCQDVDEPLPLPGVVIFVHGVNSVGEWFDTGEERLCKGLSARLQREDDHVFRVKGSGQFRPATYMNELIEDGYLPDRLSAATFVKDAGYSPVIRFRWGYKSSVDELNAMGDNILLDEKNAWGGDPFVNGCSALPDIFNRGTDAELVFGALSLTHLQTSDRQVYSVPARHYQAFAAWRPAKLVSRIREVHRTPKRDGVADKDRPITVICHSQGNTIGIGSAYFDAHHSEFNGEGKCNDVADSYVLACAPYSLRRSWIDSVSQYDSKNEAGRVTYEVRAKGLRSFFDIVRGFGKERAQHYGVDFVTQHAFNHKPRNGDAACTAEQDCKGRDTRACVFLYYSPHDRVISAAAVCGMGWLGLNKEDVEATGADGVLYQRVWVRARPGVPYRADGIPGTDYRYWNDTIGANPETSIFWTPDSEHVSVQFKKIWTDDRKGFWGKLSGSIVGSFMGADAAIANQVSNVAKVSDVPDRNWAVRADVPAVPSGGIVPHAVCLARGDGSTLSTKQRYIDNVHTLGPSNAHYESARDALNPVRQVPQSTEDPYAQQRTTGYGSAASEAAMYYDQNVDIRQRARRNAYHDNGVLQSGATFDKNDIALMDGENHHKIRGTEFGKFGEQARATQLKEGDRQQPADHPTILTNPGHSEHVLAYDVDVGMCLFTADHMAQFRRMAGWRRCEPLKNKDVYPAGRDPKRDVEFKCYHSEKATLNGSPLEGYDKFVKAEGGVTAIGIPGDHNPGHIYSYYMPDESDTRYAWRNCHAQHALFETAQARAEGYSRAGSRSVVGR